MISVLFATHNGARTLRLMLPSLLALDYPVNRYEIIAVNNASTDDTQDVLEEYAARLPLTILTQAKRGKNPSLNLGLECVRGELVVLTDDDVIADRDWLSAFEAAARRLPEIDLFGGQIQPHWLKAPPDWLLSAVPLGVTFALTAADLKEGPIFPGLIWGANMMVRKRVFEAGHRFNEGIGPNVGPYIMGSETEFNIRTARQGYRTWFCTDAIVRHVIREHQICAQWATDRAYRFGRNKFVQDESENTGSGNAGRLLNFPRWMLRKAISHAFHAEWARIRKDRAGYVRNRWDYMFYRGYMSEARRARVNIR